MNCQDCNCGRGQGRNCKLRQPGELPAPGGMWQISPWLLIAALLAGLLLTGCKRTEVVTDEHAEVIWSPAVFIDDTTGCQYLAANYASALTPRLSAEGKQICNPPKKGSTR